VTTHRIEPAEGTLHGVFGDHGPIVTIASGDRIHTRTPDAGWAPLDLEAPVTLDAFLTAPRIPRPGPAHNGHCLVGPVAIEGAEPGMTVEVRLLRLRPGAWGWTAVGGWDTPLMQVLKLAHAPREHFIWNADEAREFATNQMGDRVRLRPFLGVVGLEPAGPGPHSTIPPRRVGGNIDCKELVEGSVLFLPVEVAGGLLSLGDGHAVQGDGEAAGTAIECPMEEVLVEVHLHRDLELNLPRAETPAGRVVMAFDDDLNTATLDALEGMLGWMQEVHGLSRARAVALASLVVDLRITQIANGVCGVHAVWPPDQLVIA
jgi:acetamidase/formamidase